jgi:hypothetical protein
MEQSKASGSPKVKLKISAVELNLSTTIITSSPGTKLKN